MSDHIRFLNKQETDFFKVLQDRVNHYFKSHGLKRDGGALLLAKSLFLLTVFVVPFIIVLTAEPSLVIATFLLIVMGVGKAAVGMSIMHDALHGSFSNKQWVNDLFGGTLYLLGGNPINWRIQHNILHHTYPNVYKVDEDVSTKAFILRLSPESKLRKVHKYQWLYIIPLYGLMTLSFMVKDFRQLTRYNKMGATKRQGFDPRREMFRLIITKIVYLFTTIGLPLLLTGYSVIQVISGFLIVHFTAGLILSLVFQLAHVVEGVEYPERNLSGDLDSSWALHQLATTSNFAPQNRFVHWFTGGLNHQVEHHLFPHISHVHYRSISKIVQATSEEFGFVYNSYPTVLSALNAHIRMLKNLGKERKFEMA